MNRFYLFQELELEDSHPKCLLHPTCSPFLILCWLWKESGLKPLGTWFYSLLMVGFSIPLTRPKLLEIKRSVWILVKSVNVPAWEGQSHTFYELVKSQPCPLVDYYIFIVILSLLKDKDSVLDIEWKHRVESSGYTYLANSVSVWCLRYFNSVCIVG